MIAPDWTRPGRGSFMAPVLAAVLFVASLGHAVRVELPHAERERQSADGEAPAAPMRAQPTPADAITAAVARDPFRPDRQRPPDRYRMPGEPAAEHPAAAPPRAFPRLELIGTAAFADGRGLAALSTPGGARLLRVGDTFHGLKLVRVDDGAAVLDGGDTTIVLTRTVPAGPRGGSP